MPNRPAASQSGTKLNPFERHVYQQVSAAIKAIDSTAAADIYALSLQVSVVDDDSRQPMLQLGYNTLGQARACTPQAGQAPGWPIASDADEATWNFAFWLQNELLFIGEPGTPSATLLVQLLKSEGLWYPDSFIAEDEEGAYALDDGIMARFAAMLVRVVQELHASGVITGRFGNAIPVLIHELDYHGAIARQNLAANPDGPAADFVAWIDRQEISR